MALAVVGGALLSAFFDVLFDRLASPELVNLIRGKKPDKLLQKVEKQLIVIRVVLADAENRQITDPNVKKWLDLLRDLVYEVDDLLDEVSTKAAIQKKFVCVVDAKILLSIEVNMGFRSFPLKFHLEGHARLAWRNCTCPWI